MQQGKIINQLGRVRFGYQNDTALRAESRIANEIMHNLLLLDSFYFITIPYESACLLYALFCSFSCTHYFLLVDDKMKMPVARAFSIIKQDNHKSNDSNIRKNWKYDVRRTKKNFFVLMFLLTFSHRSNHFFLTRSHLILLCSRDRFVMRCIVSCL